MLHAQHTQAMADKDAAHADATRRHLAERRLSDLSDAPSPRVRRAVSETLPHRPSRAGEGALARARHAKAACNTSCGGGASTSSGGESSAGPAESQGASAGASAVDIMST